MEYRFIFFIIFSLIYNYCLCQEDINPDGYNIFYYGNGQISSEGSLKNGKPDGYWKTYYVDGTLKSEGLRRNFLLDSTWIFYDNDGDTTEKVNYYLGKKNGFHYKYFCEDTNIIQSKELFVNNIQVGFSYYYYKNGKIREIIPFKNGKKHGLGKEFCEDSLIITLYEFDNGRLVNFESINRYNDNNEKEGLWKMFYPNNRIKTETIYKNGLKNGLFKEYDINGNLIKAVSYENDSIINEDYELNFEIDYRSEYDSLGRLIKQGSFLGNIPIGIHREYDLDGKVIKTFAYADNGILYSYGIIDESGKKQGMFEYYYPDKKIKAKGEYLNNRRIGQWTFYFQNSNIEQEGHYKNGYLDGEWTWYYKNGNVWRIEHYLQNKEDGESVEYDSLGNVISKGNYIEGLKEGKWFYQIGDQIEKGNYANDLKDGIWEHYYLNGQLSFKGKFIRGLPDGKHKYYYKNGNLKEEQYYSAGSKEKNWKIYDIGENLIVVITYKNDQEYKINGSRIE